MTLGQAERNAGRTAEALETFQRSADLARELGSAKGLARAALGYEESRWRLDLPVGASARLLTDALHALGEEESVLRVRVWVNLLRSLMSTSSKRYTPLSGRSRRPMILSNVDFPEPEGPIMAIYSPGATVRLTSLSA